MDLVCGRNKAGGLRSLKFSVDNNVDSEKEFAKYRALFLDSSLARLKRRGDTYLPTGRS